MSTAAASKPSELCPASRGLSFLDRYLTLWIFLAMALGVGLGFLCARCAQAITRMSSTPLHPHRHRADRYDVSPAGKGPLEDLPQVFRNTRVLESVVIQNWW